MGTEGGGGRAGGGGGWRLESPTCFAKSFLVPQFFPQPNQIVASPDAKHLDFDLWQQPTIFMQKMIYGKENGNGMDKHFGNPLPAPPDKLSH